MVNIGTSSSAPTSLVTLISVMAHSPTLAIKVSFALEVDRLVVVVTTLKLEESTSLQFQRRGYGIRNNNPPKLRVLQNGFVLLKVMLSGRSLPSCRCEMSFLLSLIVLLGRRRLLFLRQIYHSFIISLNGISWNWFLSLPTTCSKLFLSFSLVSVGRGDVLALGNPFKERDIGKGNVDTMEPRCVTL